MLRTLLALVAVVLAGGGVLWWGIDGGRAFTAETARRLDIAAHSRLLPDVKLADSTGTRLSLADYRGAPLVLEFIYASCPDICVALGSAFERIDAAAPSAVRLLSISFDPADDAERLGGFAERHGASAPRWRVAGVPETKDRATLLDRAGVVVVPDGAGGFVHNAGLYLVDAEGRLIRVFEPEDAEGALRALEALAR